MTIRIAAHWVVDIFFVLVGVFCTLSLLDGAIHAHAVGNAVIEVALAGLVAYVTVRAVSGHLRKPHHPPLR